VKFSLFSETFEVIAVGLLGKGWAEGEARVGGGGRRGGDAVRGGEEEPEQDRGRCGAAGEGGEETSGGCE